MSMKNQTRWLALVLLGLLTLSGGCDNWGWLNFNIVVPLGLPDGTGILTPFTDGTFFVPINGDNSSTEPPPPIQGGEQPGGDTTGGTTGVTQ